MRDKEFLKAIEEMTPILNRKFHNLIKGARIRDDIESLKNDLIQWTILGALRNSRMPIHRSQTCIQLIKTKACNVWSEYYKTLSQSFNHPNHEDCELIWKGERDPYRVFEATETMQRLEEQVTPQLSMIFQMKLKGYKNKEIAAFLDTTEDAINMMIYRLKLKIKSRTRT